MTDLYDILQVDKNSTAKQIKDSYKKLAFKYHPDKNPDTKDKFQKISEAYDILSNEKKRKNYDLFGYDQNISSVNPIELFESLFNVDILNNNLSSNIFFFSDLSNNSFPTHKPCLKHVLNLTLQELYSGSTKEFSIRHLTKKKYEDTKYVINVKPGTKHKENIIVKEGGNYLEDLDMCEDLFIEINEIQDNNYKRKDNDLYIVKQISLLDALCDTEYSVKLFDTIITVNIDDIIKPYHMYKVYDKGMPIKYDTHSLSDDSDRKSHGDLIIDFNIEFPDNLDDEDKGYLINILKQGRVKEEKSEELVQGYYYMNSQDVVKEIIEEDKDDGLGCIQQ